MSAQESVVFADWLRAQLKGRRMSQRQLAHRSGVDHSTISRLLCGYRDPSYGPAIKLARGLRVLHDDGDTGRYLGDVASHSSNPIVRVEYALRADETLGEHDVRQVMDYYLALRSRRLAVRQRPDAARVRSVAVTKET